MKDNTAEMARRTCEIYGPDALKERVDMVCTFPLKTLVLKTWTDQIARERTRI